MKQFTNKQRNFIDLVAINRLEPAEAYVKVYGTENKERAAQYAYMSLRKPDVKAEVERLRQYARDKAIVVDMTGQVAELAPQAISVVQDLMSSAESESVRLEAAKQVLDRVSPKRNITNVIKISAHIGAKLKDIYQKNASRSVIDVENKND